MLSLWYKSEREGYFFDQQEYALDPAQRERVARDNNLDVDLCDLRAPQKIDVALDRGSV